MRLSDSHDKPSESLIYIKPVCQIFQISNKVRLIKQSLSSQWGQVMRICEALDKFQFGLESLLIFEFFWRKIFIYRICRWRSRIHRKSVHGGVGVESNFLPITCHHFWQNLDHCNSKRQIHIGRKGLDTVTGRCDWRCRRAVARRNKVVSIN